MKTLYYRDNTDLTFKPVKISHYIYTTLLIIFITSSFSFTSAIKLNNYVEKIGIIIRTNEQEFSEENLRNEIKRLNLKFPEVVYQQCIIEGASKTGKRWNNPIFIEGNNFLGLKKSFYRPSTAISWNQDYYCQYNSWRDCLLDYSLFQATFVSKIKSEQEYYQFLNDLGYSISPEYVNTLKTLK